MMPAVVPLEIYQGDRYELKFRVRTLEEVNGTWVPGEYVDLTGRTPKAQIRSTADAAVVAVEFTCTLSDQVATPGEVVCVLTPAQTRTLAAGKYVYDAQIETSVDFIETYLRGAVTVTGDVTRD